jgi:hypothetical protein
MTRAFSFRLGLAAAAALMLAACETPTVYAPAQRIGGPGYTESQIETDRFRVTFNATSGGPQTAEDMARRRAAGIALERGYDWFMITNRFVEPYGGGGTRSSLSIGTGFGSFGRGSFSSVGVGVGVPLGRNNGGGASVSLEVRLGKGQRPNDPQAFDARDVQRLMGTPT